jgi:hypothetical protein
VDPEDVSLERLQKLNDAAHRELEELERKLNLVRPKQGSDEDNDTDENDSEEPDAPVPASLLPRTPVLTGGNARRLEEAAEEAETT